jgi:hypothetical protein
MVVLALLARADSPQLFLWLFPFRVAAREAISG